MASGSSGPLRERTAARPPRPWPARPTGRAGWQQSRFGRSTRAPRAPFL